MNCTIDCHKELAITLNFSRKYQSQHIKSAYRIRLMRYRMLSVSVYHDYYPRRRAIALIFNGANLHKNDSVFIIFRVCASFNDEKQPSLYQFHSLPLSFSKFGKFSVQTKTGEKRAHNISIKYDPYFGHFPIFILYTWWKLCDLLFSILRFHSNGRNGMKIQINVKWNECDSFS